MSKIIRRIIVGALIGAALTVSLLAGLREYGIPGITQNGGITYGRCGIELWGSPGHFCDQD